MELNRDMGFSESQNVHIAQHIEIAQAMDFGTEVLASMRGWALVLGVRQRFWIVYISVFSFLMY